MGIYMHRETETEQSESQVTEPINGTEAKRHGLLLGTEILRHYGSKMFQVRGEKAARRLRSQAAKREMSRHCEGGNGLPTEAIRLINNIFGKITPHPLFKKNFSREGKRVAFTLAEVLITLGIIGVVAAMTISPLVKKYQEKAVVSRLLKFYSTLSQTVDMLIVRNGGANISDIISNTDGDGTAFDSIAKEMKIIKSCTNTKSPKCSTAAWLPDYSYDYLGNIGDNVSFGAVAKHGYGNACYLLADGTAFCMDVNPDSYCISVDVNGKNKPNRVGQDIFSFSVGYNGQKVIPEEIHNPTYVLTSHGICTLHSSKACDPMNLDPEKDGGASPTSYVLLTKKLPPKIK